jgi:ribosomal protein S18 acetylase RimI-like enzyme
MDKDREEDDVIIRPARVSDAPGIAHVLVDTFLDTYRGIIQDSILNRLSIPGRSTRWEQVIAAKGSDIVLVAVDSKSNRVLGYAYGGSSRDVSLPDGEIYQLYVHPKAQGQHLGERLFKAFARMLWLEGYVSMVVHVLEGNPAMHFYQRMGGEPMGSRMTTMDGMPYRENSFRWPDLDAFMQ